MARFAGATPFGSARRWVTPQATPPDPDAPKVTWRQRPPVLLYQDKAKWQDPSALFQLFQLKQDPKESREKEEEEVEKIEEKEPEIQEKEAGGRRRKQEEAGCRGLQP